MPFGYQTTAPEGTQRLPTVESTGGEVFSMPSFDGIPLRCARWPAERRPGLGSVLYLQGRTEFIEKNLETIAELRRRGYVVWTLDWRGQGLSGRLLTDPHKGHVANYDDYLQDLQLLVGQHMAGRASGPTTLLAHSMGAHIGLRFMCDHPGFVERAVLSAPMIGIRRGPVAVGARLLAATATMLGGGQRYVPGTGRYDIRTISFDGNALTSDADRFYRMHAYIAADPRLALGGPTYGWLAASFRSIARLRQMAKDIRQPVLMVNAGDERVVDNGATHWLLRHGLSHARLTTIAGARHDILCERDDIRNRFWQAFDDFTGRSASS